MDFVILCVNDKDLRWRDDYEHYSLLDTGEKRECRFRDWENLHYWFRGVEKFAPWVDRVFLILATPAQLPEWLNTAHPKLRIVYHEEYIPKDILPTFNSNTIEMFLPFLPDLSEQFVLFNDDFFLIDKISPERFFQKGLPVDICAMNAYHGGGVSSNNMCNIEVLNRNFDKKKSLRTYFYQWFSPRNGVHLIRTLLLAGWPQFVGFYDHHFPQPFLKSLLKEVWEKESRSIRQSITRFRAKNNLTQYLFRYWQLATGTFTCRNIGSDSIYFEATDDTLYAIAQTILKQKKKIVVINDSEAIDFEKAKEMINHAFSCILPEKSSFEK